jgi:hypothetical protein
MTTPEERAAAAARSRKRWAQMSPEKKQQRLQQQRDYARAKRKQLKRVDKPRKRSQFINGARLERYNFVLQLKFERGACCDCGLEVTEWNHPCMEWDHRNPSHKEFELSRAGKMKLSAAEIRHEADKCDLVCANCHRMRTYWERHHDPQTRANSLEQQMSLFDE